MAQLETTPRKEQFESYRNQLLAKNLEPNLATEAAFVLAYKDPAGRGTADQLVIDRAFKALFVEGQSDG